VNQGEPAVVTMTPSASATVKTLTIDGVPVSPDLSLTITGVVADHEVSVVFVARSGTTVYSGLQPGQTLAEANLAGAHAPKWRPGQYTGNEPEPPRETHRFGRRMRNT